MNPLLFWFVAALRARDYRWARCHRSVALEFGVSGEVLEGRKVFAEYTERLGWWCSLWPLGGGA